MRIFSPSLPTKFHQGYKSNNPNYSEPITTILPLTQELSQRKLAQSILIYMFSPTLNHSLKKPRVTTSAKL